MAYFDGAGVRLSADAGKVPDHYRTAAVECICKRRARFRSFRASIPPEFRAANLARLKPRLDKHPGQAEITQAVREFPFGSYVFCGRNRAGKSHIGWCLARNSYLSGYRVVASNLSVLLDEYRACERQEEDRPAPKPLVVSGDLVVRGVRYCLFLQEFDKPRPTQYAAERLFDLIDTAFTYQHQLIITCNLSTKELRAHWSEHGSRYGNGIVSRIVERCDEVNMF